MSASLREKVMKILKDLETQKRQIIELKSENQSLRATRASGLIPEAGLSVKITEPDLTSRHEQSVLRVESFDVAVLTEGDYVSMDEFRLIVDKYERLSVEARENRIGLQKEVSDLQAVAQDLTALVDNLRHENQGLRASVGYMDEIQVSMRKQIETLQVQEEGYQITVGNLKKELETGGEEARILGRRATELEELNRTLRRELEEMEQRTLHVGREAELVRNLSAENAELAQKLERLEYVEQRRDVVIDENVRSVVDGKSKRLEKLESELSKTLKDSRQQAKELLEWKNKHATLKESYEELLEKLAQANKMIAGLKNMIGGLQNQLITARKALPQNIAPRDASTKSVPPKPTESEAKRTVLPGKVINKVDLIKQQPAKEEPKPTPQAASQNKNQGSAENPKPPARAKPVPQADQKSEPTNPESSKTTPKNQTEFSQPDHQREASQDINFEALEDKAGYEQYMSTLLREGPGSQLNSLPLIDDPANPIDEALLEFLKRQDTQALAFQKVTLNRSVQTDYFSVIEWILENEADVRNNENDFEKIKEVVDILADMIGFNGVEDYTRLVEPSGQEDAEHFPAAAEQEQRLAKQTHAPRKDFKPLPAKKKVKVLANKLPLKAPVRLPGVQDSPGRKENAQPANFIEDEVAPEPRRQFKLPAKKPTTRTIIERNENPEEFSDDQDQIIQKSRIVRTGNNKNETYEVIEYIRVPKELSVVKSTLPKIQKDNLTDFELKEIQRLANQSAVSANSYETELREREKLYFRIYINIKQRYQYKPEIFLRIFKLTFNKVPEFENRLDEGYNPKAFLFNFEEFKHYFKQVLHTHQFCGRYCVHFSRFYEKMGLVNSQRVFYRAKSQYIDKLPQLLIDQTH